MKTSFAALIAVGLTLSAAPAFASRIQFKSSLDSADLGTGATGEGHFTYDNTSMVLCGKITYSGLTGGALTSAAFKNATDQTLVKSFTPGPSPLTMSVVLSPGQANLLTQDQQVNGPGFYVALGNTPHPVSNNTNENGELNGELVTDPGGVDQCPVGTTDAGSSGSDAGAKDAGGTSTSSSSGSTTSSSGSSTSSGDTTSSSSGATSSTSSGDTSSSSSSSSGGDADDAGASSSGATAAPPKDSGGGCSSTGSASGGSAILGGVLALMLAGRSRRRR